MNPLAHVKDQRSVETVNFIWRTCSEACSCFRGLTRCNLPRSPGEGHNRHSQIRRIKLRTLTASTVLPRFVENLISQQGMN